jgi:3',5'-cyclic AMP phosphodiesterase CpdA
MKNNLVHASIIILTLSFFSCSTTLQFTYTKEAENPKPSLTGSALYPDADIAVISDIHLCRFAQPSKAGGADMFTKLLKDSVEINEAASAIIRQSDSRIVIIPGDLTEFGEYSDHLEVRSILERIEANGRRVFVVPGNHDIANYNARLSPSGPDERPITKDEFAEIYSDFGYGEALARDASSLSYVAEPAPGLWFLALDACRYDEQSAANPTVTGGRLKSGTLAWAERMLAKAANEKKAVIAFMHHNLLEHFSGEKKYFGAYVVENNDAIAQLLAHYGVRLVFTGHYHAQDITLARTCNGNTIYDIETGSLVSYPCPIRFVHISTKEQMAFFSSTRISATTSHPSDFQAYVKSQLEGSLMENADSVLRRFGIAYPDDRAITKQVADGYMAHAEGDEDQTPSTWNPAGAGCFYGFIMGLFMTDLASSIWKDLPPPDDNIVIDLAGGKWSTD